MSVDLNGTHRPETSDCRWYITFPRVRDHVRHATLSTILGRRTASGSESTVLHISEWWLLDSDQGAFASPENTTHALNATYAGVRSMNQYTRLQLVLRHILLPVLSGLSHAGNDPRMTTTKTCGMSFNHTFVNRAVLAYSSQYGEESGDDISRFTGHGYGRVVSLFCSHIIFSLLLLNAIYGHIHIFALVLFTNFMQTLKMQISGGRQILLRSICIIIAPQSSCEKHLQGLQVVATVT